jgi:hypothetical protein
MPNDLRISRREAQRGEAVRWNTPWQAGACLSTDKRARCRFLASACWAASMGKKTLDNQFGKHPNPDFYEVH